MNVNDLTVGQARELAALFGSPTPAPVAPHSVLEGQLVVVRSTLSGVWFGRLEKATAPAGVTLTDARRAWSWTGAGSCSALALRGPTGGKIEAPVARVVIPEIVEIISATDAAREGWARVAAWIP